MTTPAIRPIVLLNHPKDVIHAKALKAALSKVIDDNQYEVWQRGEDETALSDVPTQFQDKLEIAAAVIFLVGPEGTNEAAAAGPARTMIWERLEASKRDFGRLVVRLPNAPERDTYPSIIKSWVWIDAPDAPEFGTVVASITTKLSITTRFRALAIDEGLRLLPDGPDRDDLVDQFRQTAQLVGDGKPITLMLGPYASADGEDDHSCPSYIRRRLMGLITDPQLRKILVPPKETADMPDGPPMLWQDHLATICLLGGSSREDVIKTIARSVREAAGDAKGSPHGLFKSIAAFASQIQKRGKRSVGLPGITIISVCPGLRVERALIAAKCDFERVTLLFGTDKGVDLHRKAYRPDGELSQRAQSGEEVNFMPPPTEPNTADQLDFIRIVKPFGSRDLNPGVPSGDLGQAYDALGQLKARLDRLVSAVGSGPYIVLGGGLGTPPLQAVHALLLREALEQAELRPLLAIAPAKSISPDPLRQLETDRVKSVGGAAKLQILSSDPGSFIDALTVAFGGAPLSQSPQAGPPPASPPAPAPASPIVPAPAAAAPSP